MKLLKLGVKQCIAYKITSKRKHSDKVANNLLNQNFNPLASDEVLAGDITYLKTSEG
jgi:putative transposase